MISITMVQTYQTLSELPACYIARKWHIVSTRPREFKGTLVQASKNFLLGTKLLAACDRILQYCFKEFVLFFSRFGRCIEQIIFITEVYV
jgi:hypothetical protein